MSVELLVNQILLVVVVWAQNAVQCSVMVGVIVVVVVPHNAIKSIVAHVVNAVSHVVDAVSHVIDSVSHELVDKVVVLQIVITVHSACVHI